MNKPRNIAGSRATFARSVPFVWILWALLVLGAFFFRRHFALPGTETFLLVGPIIAILAAPRAPEAFKNSPAKYRVYSFTLVFLVAAGILLKRDAQTFPFVSWDMFSKTQYGVPSAIQCRATLKNGREITFHPEQWLTAVSESRVAVKIQEQIDHLRPGDFSPEQARLASIHKRTLTALAGLYNQGHLQNPIVALAVYRMSMTLPQQDKPLSKVPQFLWAFPLDPASPSTAP